MNFEAVFKDKFTVEMNISGHKVCTDLPESMGGKAAAPTPLELMLSALLSCSASSVYFYLVKHELPSEGIKIFLNPSFEKDMVTKAEITINLPPSFPEDKKAPLLAFARHCKVGGHLKFQYDVKLETSAIK